MTTDKTSWSRTPTSGRFKAPAGTFPPAKRVVKVQFGPSYGHDPRYQCAPGEAVPEHFSAYLPGIDPATGKPWGANE